MAVFIMRRLSVDTGLVNFDLDFQEPIVTIGGNSATGKSYLISQIRFEQTAEIDNPRSNIVCIDFSTPLEEVKRVLSESSNKLIIIDNADILLPELGILNGNRFRKDNKNQYLIFSRCGTQYGSTDRGIGELIWNHDHAITID